MENKKEFPVQLYSSFHSKQTKTDTHVKAKQINKYQGIAGTTICFLMNPDTAQLIKIRALHDSGSNSSLVEKEVATKAHLSGPATHLIMNVAGNNTVTSKQQEVSFCLVSLDKRFVSDPIVATTIEKIGEPFPPIKINPKLYDHLRNIKFTEKYPMHESRPFQVLIAEPYYSQLMLQEQCLSPDPAIPSAKLTKLGWMLRGAVGVERSISSVMYTASGNDYMNYELEMIYKDITENFDFGKFWSGENVGISPHEPDGKSLTAMELQADYHQSQTAKYDKEKKRWSVELPWKDSSPETLTLSNNYPRAVAMCHKVHERVKPEHMALVNDAYQEFFDNGFSEIVPPEQEHRTDHPTYVMTSRPVIRLDKQTTKCRIVINASLPDQKDKKKTLNKLLMPGKNMLPQIMELVLHSKLKQFLVTIDIRKMFLSVRLSKESDKDMLRYVWAPPGHDKPIMYRFTCLPFGCVSSPYQAIWCLHETAKKWQHEYPKAAEIILNKTYMDDILVGADTVQEAIQLVKQILQILDSGGFYGHKITANDDRILQAIDPKRIDASKQVSVLGLKLNHMTNEFQFDLDDKFNQFKADATKITRRDIVSLASQVFDTQGYVSPFVMKFKRLLPMLWHNKTGWDENLLTKSTTDESGNSVPEPVAKEAVLLFREWVSQIPLLKELQFPRWLGGPIQFLAIFGDASKMGMGVAAYAVSKSADGHLVSQLVFSKSSLMPKNLREKAQVEDACTIARAELIALVMAVNVGKYLTNAFQPYVCNKDIVYFTDSLLNLQRVQRGKGHCKQWEERRVLQILDNLSDAELRFCPGILNPADLPSRGLSMDEFLEKLDFWKSGPTFLVQPKPTWPKQPLTSSEGNLKSNDRDETQKDLDIYFSQLQACTIADIEEEKVQIFAMQQMHEPAPLAFLDKLVANCSSWSKAVNVLVRIKRLAQKIRESRPQRALHTRNPMKAWLTHSELDWAEKTLIRHEQSKCLSKEMEILQKGNIDHQNKLPKGSSLQHLPVYWDDSDKIIRLKTRLSLASSLSDDYTNPIVIPKGMIAEKKILHLHQSRMHISQKQTFHLLRQKYWMLGNFTYIKSVVQKCKTPRCRYIKFSAPKMSPLPKIRIDDPKPWTKVGIDYLGPLLCAHDCSEEMSSLRESEKTSEHQRETIRQKKSKCIHPKLRKVWIALFTCFHTRAIHCEVVETCSTLDFLHSFRRFIGHCGRPETFYSDNARQFHAADKNLKELLTNVNFDRIQSECFNGDSPIEWKFSTPEAPWTNGVTERMVGIFKRQLKITLRKELLTVKSLETLIIELTSIINDRPLGVMQQNPNEWTNVTPNLLIFGRHLGGIQAPTAAKLSTTSYSDLWIERKRIIDQFWDEWRKQYLQELSVDKKWLNAYSPVIKEGDVVILKPDTMEKNVWKLARITAVQTTQDGVVSTVTVRLPHGQEMLRSVRQIALIEPELDDLLEKGNTEALQQAGHAGSLRRTLTGLSSVAQLDSVTQSPVLNRPYQGADVANVAPDPDNATTVIAESVSQTNATAEVNDANTSQLHNLRKNRRRVGYYKNLIKNKN